MCPPGRRCAVNKETLRAADVVGQLPDINGRGDKLPHGLEGATIIRIGTLRDWSAVEGGGLIIDYRPSGSEELRRVVLGFNELGMWEVASFQA
jgi:hypothetical protein